MSAYFVTLPVLPWWVPLAAMVFLGAVGAALAWLVSALLGRHRPARYWKMAAVAVGGFAVLVGAFALWMHVASNQPSDTVMQSVIDDAWPHLGPVTVTGTSVLTDDGQDCDLTMWKASGAHYVMVVCDGDPVSRLG